MRGLMQATYRVPVRKTCWIDSVIPPAGLLSFEELRGPRVDFAQLADLQGTLALLRQTGVVQ